MFTRRNAALLVGEFLGTAILTFVVLAVSRSSIGIPYFVAFGAGLSIMLSGLAIMGTLGAGGVQFNPALTFALWTTRQVKTLKAIAYIAVQLLGGYAAFGLYKYLGHIPLTNTGGSFDSHILVAEAVGTFVFTFVASGVLFQRMHGVLQSVVVGGAYAVGVMVASVGSSALLNPAIALGADSWSWGNYVLGPVLGAVIGVNLYALLFAGKSVLRSSTTKVSTARTADTKSTSSSVARAKKPATTKKAKATRAKTKTTSKRK